MCISSRLPPLAALDSLLPAPETAQRPYGTASRQRLQALAPVGSVVTLRPQTIDKYGRTVAEMFRNGQNVNLAMVSSGQAYPLRGPAATPTGSIWAPAMAPPTSSSLAIRFHSKNRSQSALSEPMRLAVPLEAIRKALLQNSCGMAAL